MNKNLSLLSALLISSIILVSCGNPPQKPQMAAAVIPVVTIKASEEPVSGTDSYPGTVVALNEVELRAQVGGYITRMFVRDGQNVSRGQKLYEIDKSKFEAVYRQAQAQVQIAKSNRDKAAKDLERYTRLAEQDAIAKQRVDYARTDVANAESLIAGAESAAANALVDLRHATVTAPLSGTIGISLVKLGALVSPGTTLLNTISNTNPIAVDLFVGQAEIQRFINLQQRGANDSTFTVEVGGQKLKLSGRIHAIDRSVDPTTGTIKVRLAFPNNKGELRAGMSCTIDVLNQDIGNQLTIPFKAVSETMGEYFVYTLTDSSTATQRKVSLGSRYKDKIVVRTGLKPGETIVLDGIQNLREGSKVQVGDTAPAAGTPGQAAQTKPAGK